MQNDLLPENIVKENLSLAMIHAIASVAKCTCDRKGIDIDSVDCQLSHPGYVNSNSTLFSPHIAVQAKATWDWEWKKDQCAFDLKMKNYNELRVGRHIPSILLVLLMPRNPNLWLEAHEDYLQLRHCIYWHDITTEPAVTNQTSRVIYLSKKKAFTPEVLRKMMGEVSCGRDFSNV